MPLRETEEDRKQEAIIANQSFECWKCSSVRMKKLWVFDYLILRNSKNYALIEIKDRKHKIEKYETLLISKAKIDNILKLKTKYEVEKATLIIRFKNEIFWTSLTGNYDYGVNGWSKPRGEDDREICYYIPINEFEKLEK